MKKGHSFGITHVKRVQTIFLYRSKVHWKSVSCSDSYIKLVKDHCNIRHTNSKVNDCLFIKEIIVQFDITIDINDILYYKLVQTKGVFSVVINNWLADAMLFQNYKIMEISIIACLFSVIFPVVQMRFRPDQRKRINCNV